MTFKAPTKHHATRRVIQAIVGVIVIGWSLIPIYWGVVVSFSTPAGIHQSPPPILPFSFTWSNYAAVLDPANPDAQRFFMAIGNSALQAVGATALTLLFALPAAYAFARLRFRGSGTILTLLVTTMAMPVYLVMIPLFQFAVQAGQINVPFFVILILASGSVPLAVWILRSHIASLPADLEAAARLDGCSTGGVLIRIVGPLVAPGVVASAVVVFLGAWGAFLLPGIFTNSPNTQTLTLLVPTFATKFAQDLGVQAAAGLLGLAVPALLVVLLQRYLVSGLLKGASR
ncbi:carbohydrate ABC transporter permease [Amnibacterium sp. CER49]|uniref:carbohydrate ABC transporter permease n=1 Tax=Amnibacterium sp. CER49 TaxID=3039161 RepID=UPI002448A291|nr:carbohydrate ABC transporter permease [Amnibacterium sp. CER49]MDH2442568.1 carbohydrate ABC transporter permease [Amnibacterium sp. CER49]